MGQKKSQLDSHLIYHLIYFFSFFSPLLISKSCILSKVGAASPVAGSRSGSVTAQSSTDGQTAPPGPLVTEDRILILFFPRDRRDTADADPLWRIYLFIFVVCHRCQASVVSASLRSAAATVTVAANSTISHGHSVGISTQLHVRKGKVLSIYVFCYLFIFWGEWCYFGMLQYFKAAIMSFMSGRPSQPLLAKRHLQVLPLTDA